MLHHISFQQWIKKKKKSNYYLSHSVFAQTPIYYFFFAYEFWNEGRPRPPCFFKMFKKSEQDTDTEYKTHLQSC